MSSDPGDALLDGTAQQLDPRIKTVWAIGRALPVVVIAIGLAVLAGRAGAIIWLVATLVATPIGVGAAVASAVWSWRCWSWTTWNDALEMHHGVVVRESSLVPYHRIQQIDIHRGPLERLLSLSTLILRTAAATTDARIPGVAASQAEALRHQLLARAGVDDAV